MTRLLKDSGIPWINQIPQNREVKKVKYTLLSRNENNNPIRSRDILSLTAKQGVIPLDEKEWWWNKPKEDYSAYKLAYPWDIVINSMNILSWSVWLSNYFWCVSPVYYMLRSSKANDDVRFFNYIFQTKVFQLSLLWLWNWILIKESDSWKFNTIRMRIPLDKFWNLYIPIPSSEEQKKISNYLDKKIWEIDSLYADIEKQIEKLEEYKRSVITEAVTKWLNPNIEMKDSGIEWIWKIPAHRAIIRFKYTHTGSNVWEWLNREFRSDKDDNITYYTAWLDPIFTTFTNFPRRKFVKKNDLLLARNGTPYVYLPEIWATYSDHIIRVSIDDSCYDKRFIRYCLQQSINSVVVDVVSIATRSVSLWNQQYITYPTIDEQRIIADYLDEKCSNIDFIINKKTHQLDILDQYKKSLIYEYVTGKKETPSNY